MTDACATCARQYSSDPESAPASSKPLLIGRELPCCSRTICAKCLNQNKRYETYCPYCQITTEPSLLPQGLRDPPPYSRIDKVNPDKPSQQSASNDNTNNNTNNNDEAPPAYSSHTTSSQQQQPPSDVKPSPPAPDVLHFVTPNDTMPSLALAYGVPLDALRRINSLYADNLLQGRRTILIPGEYYKGGVSLSPRPVEGEEEEKRKQKVRRWMVGCKCAEYDIALLYLNKADWNLEAAIQAHADDEQWEREHPLEARQKVKKGKSAKEVGMRRFVGGAR